MVQASLELSPLQVSFSRFSKKAGTFYWMISVKNQDLVTRYAHCYYDVIGFRLCQLIELGNIWMYTSAFCCSFKNVIYSCSILKRSTFFLFIITVS